MPADGPGSVSVNVFTDHCFFLLMVMFSSFSFPSPFHGPSAMFVLLCFASFLHGYFLILNSIHWSVKKVPSSPSPTPPPPPLSCSLPQTN